MWPPPVQRIPPRSAAQLPPQQLVDEGRVCFALSGLHHLTDEETEHLRVDLVLRHLGRVGGERGVDGGLDRALIADLAQAFLLDDGGGVGAGLDNFDEYLLSDAPGDRAVSD